MRQLGIKPVIDDGDLALQDELCHRVMSLEDYDKQCPFVIPRVKHVENSGDYAVFELLVDEVQRLHLTDKQIESLRKRIEVCLSACQWMDTSALGRGEFGPFPDIWQALRQMMLAFHPENERQRQAVSGMYSALTKAGVEGFVKPRPCAYEQMYATVEALQNGDVELAKLMSSTAICQAEDQFDLSPEKHTTYVDQFIESCKSELEKLKEIEAKR